MGQYAAIACSLPPGTEHRGNCIEAKAEQQPGILVFWVFLLFWIVECWRSAKPEPFFLVTAALFGAVVLWTTALFTCGKVAIRIGSGSASVFQGVGPVGYRRTYDLRRPTQIRLRKMAGGRRGNPRWAICVIGRNGEGVFGDMLSDEQRRYIGYHLALARPEARMSLDSPTVGLQ